MRGICVYPVADAFPGSVGLWGWQAVCRLHRTEWLSNPESTFTLAVAVARQHEHTEHDGPKPP